MSRTYGSASTNFRASTTTPNSTTALTLNVWVTEPASFDTFAFTFGGQFVAPGEDGANAFTLQVDGLAGIYGYVHTLPGRYNQWDLTGANPLWLTMVWDGSLTGTDRLKLYINGVLATLASNSGTPRAANGTGFTKFASGYLSGATFGDSVAEIAVWKAALTAQEAAAVGSGVWAPLIRPDALANYWPMHGRATDEEDWVGGSPLVNAVPDVAAAHPRVLYDAGYRSLFAAASSGIPTLSAATVTAITNTTAKPRVTVTF